MVENTSWAFDAGMLFDIACDHARRIEAPPRKGAKKAKAQKRSKYYCEECGWESEWMSNVTAEPSHECKSDENPTSGASGVQPREQST